MPEMTVLAPNDTSSASSARPRVISQPSDFYYVEIGPNSPPQIWDVQSGKIIDTKSGKVVGALRGQSTGSSSGTATLSIGSEDLWSGINNLLDANFAAISKTANFLPRSESLEPNTTQDQVAQEFIANLQNLITRRRLKWREPVVSYDARGEAIEISWWRVDRSLIIAVEPDNSITYLKVWGPHIRNDMEEGEHPSGNQLLTLWQWLYP